MKLKIVFILMIGLMAKYNLKAQENTATNSIDKLIVLWTSDDPYLAERMVLMYTHAAKTAGWFKEVTLIIWGPSAKLTAENLKIQEKLKEMQKDGVIIEACIACATAYNVVVDLKNLGFEVKGMGKPLTDYLKSGAKVLTF
ncbi:MAG: DsrE family protein [Bacteroidales bacterium]|nr:DsrE family protein [Bacteroidales bacterium]